MTATRALRRIGPSAAATLMAVLVALCLTAGVTAAVAVGGPAGPALGALAAAATFQALRVPVGRAASWLVDR
jgi:hypothetical protein